MKELIAKYQRAVLDLHNEIQRERLKNNKDALIHLKGKVTAYYKIIEDLEQYEASRNKLFVVGESDPNPANWNIWSEYSLVIAKNEQEAKKIGDDVICAEIPLDNPMILVKQNEPNWGEDL